MYRPIHIDRENLTIMGVPFPDLDTLNSAACAIGSNMYEGFEPTENNIALIRDYITDRITFAQFVKSAKSKVYAG
jgi:putative transcriptional regulator